MAKRKKKKAEVEAPEVKKEEATTDAPEVAEETKEAKDSKGKLKLGKLGYLGGRAIVQINERVIHGKKFNDIMLVDGTSYLLSDKDMDKQVSKEQGDLKH